MMTPDTCLATQCKVTYKIFQNVIRMNFCGLHFGGKPVNERLLNNCTTKILSPVFPDIFKTSTDLKLSIICFCPSVFPCVVLFEVFDRLVCNKLSSF